MSDEKTQKPNNTDNDKSINPVKPDIHNKPGKTGDNTNTLDLEHKPEEQGKSVTDNSLNDIVTQNFLDQQKEFKKQKKEISNELTKLQTQQDALTEQHKELTNSRNQLFAMLALFVGMLSFLTIDISFSKSIVDLIATLFGGSESQSKALTGNNIDHIVLYAVIGFVLMQVFFIYMTYLIINKVMNIHNNKQDAPDNWKTRLKTCWKASLFYISALIALVIVTVVYEMFFYNINHIHAIEDKQATHADKIHKIENIPSIAKQLPKK